MTNVNTKTITTIEFKAQDFLSKLGLDATKSESVDVESVKVLTLGQDGFNQAQSKVVVTLVSEVEERNI